jgi:hypothetical protein
MADAGYPVSEYIKAGSEAIVLIKTLYPLLPTQSRDEVEAKIYAAEEALQKLTCFWRKRGAFRFTIARSRRRSCYTIRLSRIGSVRGVVSHSISIARWYEKNDCHDSTRAAQ